MQVYIERVRGELQHLGFLSHSGQRNRGRREGEEEMEGGQEERRRGEGTGSDGVQVVIMPLIGFIISLTRNNREGASILQVENAAKAA